MRYFRPSTIVAMVAIVLLLALTNRMKMFSLVLAAAPAPGGVDTGLGLWLKADANVTNAGANVTQWDDASGNGHSFLRETASGPVYITDTTDALFNFNPYLDFNGIASRLADNDTTGLADVSTQTMFGVIYRDGSNQVFFAVKDGAGKFSNMAMGSAQLYSSNNVQFTPAGTPLNETMLVGLRGQGPSGPFDGIFNGAVQNVSPLPSSAGVSFGNNIAKVGTNGTLHFTGNLAEILLYERQLTDTELNRVMSYLAIKYGLTLTDTQAISYTSSAGTVVWDAVTNAAYHNDVAGIGRDDSSGLLQLKSRSVNSDALVTVELSGTFAADFSSLIWGNNNGSTTFDVNAGLQTHMARIWKVSEVGTVGAVTVTIPASTGAENLLVDADGDFSSGATVIPLTASGSDLIASVDMANGQFFSFSQANPVAPGGVNPNLQLWLRADVGFTPAQWNDQSGNGKHGSQIDPNYQADQIANALNFNPVIDFDGSDDYWVDHTGFPTGAAPRTAIAVATDDSLAGNRYIFSYGNASVLQAFDLGRASNDPDDLNVATWGSELRVNGTWTSNLLPHIVYGGYDGTQMKGAFDGIPIQTIPFSLNTVLNTTAYVGRVNSGGPAEYWDGKIAEVIFYGKDLSATERQQVESYLAIKYGITLASNYLDGAGNTLWNVTTNVTYTNDVAGIGIDANSALTQTTSRSVNADGMVTITGTVASISSGDFLLWGNDNGATTASSDVPSGYSQRLTRRWKVAETGDTGVVTITFDLTGVSAVDLTNAANFALLTDADGNFSNASVITGTNGASVSGNSVTFAGVNLDDGQFFSLAYPEVPAPGGVNPNLQLWLKADAGVTQAGTVSQWTDQSGHGFQANQATGANQPAFHSSALNFNPVLNFDGSNDNLTISGGIFGTATYSDLNVYAVANTEVIQASNLFQENVGADPNQVAVYFWSDARVYWDAGNRTDGSVWRLVEPWGGQTNTPYLWSFLYSTSATAIGQKQEILRNGEVIGQDATAATFTGTNQDLFVGSLGATNYYNGEIAELIVYGGNINAAQHAHIQSYLALKYGITLTGTQPISYTDSSGSLLWPGVTNIAYHNDVAGIGIDAGSALTQTTSRSINSDSIVTITGTVGVANISDGDFLLWGNDNGATSFQGRGSVSGLATVNDRLGRVWKAQETGDTGSVTVAFDGATILTGRTYCLLVDADGDFSAGATEAGCVVASSPVTFTHDFSNAAPFFTLGRFTPAPGGVGNNLQLWLKADAGITESSGSVSAWADQSGAGNNTTQATSANQPTLQINSINGNPALLLDGTDYLQDVNGIFSTATATTNAHVFVAVKPGTP